MHTHPFLVNASDRHIVGACGLPALAPYATGWWHPSLAPPAAHPAAVRLRIGSRHRGFLMCGTRAASASVVRGNDPEGAVQVLRLDDEGEARWVSAHSAQGISGALALKFQPKEADPANYRGAFVGMNTGTSMFSLHNTRHVLRITREGSAVHVEVTSTPHSWRGIQAAISAGNVFSAPSGHTSADAVTTAADYHGGWVDDAGVPRFLDGTILTHGPIAPDTALMDWAAASQACTYGSCGMAPLVRPIALAKGLRSLGVSTGDVHTRVDRVGNSDLQRTSVAATKSTSSSIFYGEGANVPPAMLYTGISFVVAQEHRGVVKCPQLELDGLRYRVATAAARGAAAAPAVAAPGAPTCTPTLESGTTSPNCGASLSAEIINLILNSDKASDLCKSVRLFGSTEAASAMCS